MAKHDFSSVISYVFPNFGFSNNYNYNNVIFYSTSLQHHVDIERLCCDVHDYFIFFINKLIDILARHKPTFRM